MQELIQVAADRTAPYMYRTPAVQCPSLSQLINGSVFLKMENQQVSGSFKARGAYNKILSIPEIERSKAFFVAASTGNHAAAFCHAMKTLNLNGKVFLPENVSQAKLDFIKSFGIKFELHGQTSLDTEIYAGRVAKEHGYTMVHPYSDLDIIAGQGTIGLELFEQIPELDTVIVPVGGGGLISGIASFLKSVNPSIQIVGCQPEMSPEMIRSIEQGSIITEDISRPTLSDGTAGGMEQDSITFAICQKLVDDWLLISEPEIADAICWMIDFHQTIIEGSAGMGIAALHHLSVSLSGKKVALIICGKRISTEKLLSVLSAPSSSL